jgi:3-oxoacyl-[acyl-carrier-protein] synthase II
MSELERPRVVVTAVGAITGHGATAAELWDNVVAGKGAIREVEHLSMEGYRTSIGGEVKDRVLPTHEYRRPPDFRDPVMDFALKAAEEAMEAAASITAAVPAERWGVTIGTCNAGLLSAEKWWIDERAGVKADPRLLMLVTPQALAEALSGAFGLKGPVLSVNTACAASANAIGVALDLIRSGQADAVLTGGSDAFSDVLYAGFNSLESLSPYPAAPYSKDRSGLSLGEGGAMLVLVREDIAKQAGAPILAEILGYGLSADGYHATAPHPEGQGAGRAIKAALCNAGVQADEVRYVNSHGTGTAKNDPAETRATKVGLGEAASRVAVSSTKSMIGHLLGAAGAVEAVVTSLALHHQIVPPTANFTESDPECDLDYVPNVARPMDMDVAMSNNFAFGGANVTIMLGAAGKRSQAVPRPDLDRPVITGIGAVTCAGADLDALWAAWVEGRSCLTQEAGHSLGRIGLNGAGYLNPKQRRRVDRLGLAAVISTMQSLETAGLVVSDDNRTRIGAILGTAVGPMESMEEFARGVIEEGANGANPAVFPNTVYNAATGQVAMLVGTTGPTSTVTAGHAAGASALCYAADLVATDQADAIVAIAADTLTDTMIGAYDGLGILASALPSTGSDAGFGLSEAGVALTVERLSVATARGATILGEVLGYGITSDAMGVGGIDPEGWGIERAMTIALERASLKTEDVVALWGSTCGVALVDNAEKAAVRRLFGDEPTLALLSPKPLFGEPFGAGAAVSAALALTGWQRGDTEHSPRGPILINSLSLGGTNICIVLAPV